MAICKERNLKNIFFISLFLLFFNQQSYAEVNFNKIKDKKVSYLDFFLLKLENRLLTRSSILKNQLLSTRVQYSNIGLQVDYDSKKKEIHILIHAIMDRNRYSKKKYIPKISDCNQVRNLIFYQKNGYTLFRQKRITTFSQSVMTEIFKEVFFKNVSFDEKEIEFLLNKMFVDVKIFHPVNKTEHNCYGKVNDYELK